MQKTVIHPIAIYLIERHPLESTSADQGFSWLQQDGDIQDELDDLIGPHDPSLVSLLKDDQPGGPAWDRLLEALVDEQIKMVITHLAPLSSTQRQQLIAICAQAGAQLITPGDAGRNREGEELFS